jgi:hypothetical protein
MSKTLDLGSERILRWLHRYPLQRVQDLIVALSPWEQRGAVYRRVAALHDLLLVEACEMAGTRLYHLSPRGLASCLGEPEPLPQEREKLVRLFPRLRVLLRVQDLVNSLVSGAPGALARAGHAPTLLRWNWLRDYAHRFQEKGQDERTLNLRVEGVLGLCLHWEGEPALWQTLLIWHTPLDDVRLLRQRFDRLLRWREQAQEIPPILILADSAHQAELWQLAASQVAARLRVERPVGAVVSRSEPLDGWRWPWRHLLTDEPCHLTELLQPGTTPALPALLEAHAMEPGQARREADPVKLIPLPAHSARSFALTAFASRQSQRDDYRLASLGLKERHWEILRLCYAHPLLGREHLSAQLGLGPKFVQSLLFELHTLGYLQSLQTPVGERWHLAEAGLRLFARAANCHVHRLVRTPVDAGQPLIQRGVTGLLHQVRHTAGVYGFFTELYTAFASLPSARVDWWESGVACERVFVSQEKTYHFKPDALASVRLGERGWRFWLEWDRGTMMVRDLETKWATYAAYLTSREWATSTTAPPRLVCVVPEIAQERRVQKVACALLAHLPNLHLLTTTASLLMRQGILAPIWQPVDLSGKLPEPSPRVALFTQEEPNR